MSKDKTQWILAFDATCATCREISDAVSDAAEGKLRVLPLTHPRVVEWRREALGADAPHAPTLIGITDSTVKAWHGQAMMIPLVRRLGLRSTIRVMGGLGQLRSEVKQPIPPSREDRVSGRRSFLKIGMGAVVASGILLTGATPAFADDRMKAAQAWVKANREQLPHGYGEFRQYQLTYRKAIHSQLTPAKRTDLWLAHLDHVRNSRTLTDGQTIIMDRVQGRLRDGILEADEPARREVLSQLADEADTQFGKEEAGRIFATLGTADGSDMTPNAELCSCSTYDDYCSAGQQCRSESTCERQVDCGFLWGYVCNGHCHWNA